MNFNLVEVLSNIINEKLEELSLSNAELKKSQEYLKVEELFSDSKNLLDVNDEDLRTVLSDITDEDTVDGIISNVDMIKIVLNGQNEGLDLSLDEGQQELIEGVYDIINNHRISIETKNTETREYLEDFISKCRGLSDEIGSGVIRSVDVLDSVLSESGVPISDIVKCKFDILRSNSNNYNLNIDSKAKEEVDLRISFKKLGVDIDSYSDFEMSLLVNYGDIDNINALVDYISSIDFDLSLRNIFILLMFSNVNNVSSIYEICSKYGLNFNRLFVIPGVFISSTELLNHVLAENTAEEGYDSIKYLESIGAYYDTFVNNISLLSNGNKSIKTCFENNILSFIIPDMSKNIIILEELALPDKEFSIVVINPFLATSISSFKDIGLSDYIKANPIRLTTSYYRFRELTDRIVDARKNGKVIFRSLSDKKNYWFSRSITCGDSEVK